MMIGRQKWMKTVEEGSFARKSVTWTFCRNSEGATRFNWQVVGYTYVHVVRRNWKQRIKLFLIRLLISNSSPTS